MYELRLERQFIKDSLFYNGGLQVQGCELRMRIVT